MYCIYKTSLATKCVVLKRKILQIKETWACSENTNSAVFISDDKDIVETGASKKTRVVDTEKNKESVVIDKKDFIDHDKKGVFDKKL